MSKETYPCIHIQENPRSIAACLLKTTMPKNHKAHKLEVNVTAGAELAGKVGRLVMYLHDKALPEKKEFGGLFSIVSGIDFLASFRNGETYLVPVGYCLRSCNVYV